MISRATHAMMDALVCAMMNAAQWRLRHHAVTRKRLEQYLEECASLDPESYFALPSDDENSAWRHDGDQLSWTSPRQTPYPENNRARAFIYDSEHSHSSPTIILLHSLMSANDFGYRNIATQFNHKGWNVLFPHLPYHYSRRPKGYANGALTITSDLVRNGETLRQSVIELRQLMAWARARGSQRIALLGTSYGAWVSALTLSVERTDFAILLQPIVDVLHATFGSPVSRFMAHLLMRNGITNAMISRHSHLTSPIHLKPLTPASRIVVIGGKYDRISPPASLRTLCTSWGDARYLEVPQGHFGYKAMRCALAEADRFLEGSSS